MERVVRERMYREGIEGVLQGAGRVDFIPPPAAGGRYNGTRVSVDIGRTSRSGASDD